MISCFFVGHRDATDKIFPALEKAVEYHITQYGVTAFIVGHYGAFDRMAARAVINAKESHPEITLSMLLPYHPAERPVYLPEGFDCSYYPPGMENVPRRFAISRANRYIIDHSHYLITYAPYPGGNARDLAAYADKRKIVVTMLSL